MDASGRPTTVSGDLTNPPVALAPLAARVQWCVWKWTQKPNGSWQKPPFVATAPDRHASTTDSATWSDYPTALATVQAGLADGVTYILTADDPFGAADIDHCRDPATGSISGWAQLLLDQATATYVEITPSGTGLRIWGNATAATSLHSNDLLDTGGRIELFRRTNKALTITGRQLGSCVSLGNIDALLDRADAWARRHKGEGAIKARAQSIDFAGSTLARRSIDDIERIVCEGAPPGGNRSDLFHAVVWHYAGCGWTANQIAKHLEQFPDGISGRYQAEGRLHGEINRCLTKWEAHRTAQQQQFNVGDWSSSWQEVTDASAESAPDPEPHPEPDPESSTGNPDPEPDESEDEPQPQVQLPPMYCHGDPDPRPITSWLVKGLLPAVSFGLLSGQWGTGKTFLVFELSGCLMTGQPFIGRRIKRQCGVLYIAAEGISEVRKRLEAVVQHKCGGMARAPFRWYEAAPVLVGPNAVEKLTAMARQAEESLQQKFGLPLGLIVVDTIAASAGYAQQGAESDSAVGAHIMRVLQQVAMACSCVVLGVDHFGKNVGLGTRGSSSKEAASEFVLACLGERETGGRVVNTRLAIRKSRGGPQGEEYAFRLREVELGIDEDREPIRTMVVDWETGPATLKPETTTDPWAECRQAETRQGMLLLKRVLMSMLAKDGVDLPLGSNEPVVRMIDQELVRREFYARTAADGTEDQKRKFRNQRFRRALDRAVEKELIGPREIDGVTYLWLMPAESGEVF